MAVNDVFAFTYWSVFGNQTAVNVLHYYVTAETGTAATDLEIANAAAGAAAPLYKGLLPAVAAFGGVKVQNIFPNLRPGTISNNGAGIGLQQSPPLPRQLCGLITIKGKIAGRRGNGRLYTPFLPLNSIDAVPEIVAGYLGSMTQLATELLTPDVYIGVNGSSTLTPCLWSKKFKTFVGIASYRSNVKIATQRRRGDFGRPNAPPT